MYTGIINLIIFVHYLQIIKMCGYKENKIECVKK